jgi:autotransporter translocation and assembly factor TamB
MSTTPPPTPHRRANAWKWLVRGLLSLAVLVAAAPLGAWLWLTSDAGGRLLRQQVLAAAAREIDGTVDVDRVRLGGLLQLEVEGIRLFAPGEQAPVVSAEKLVVDVRAMALLKKRLELAELTLTRPEVRIVPEGETTNLARALNPKNPPKPVTKSEPSAFSIHAPSIRIVDGHFSQAGEKPIEFDDIDLDLSASGRADDLVTKLALSARLKKPIEAPVKLALDAIYKGGPVAVPKLRVDLGDSFVAMRGELADPAHGTLAITDARLAAKDVNALVPTAGLLPDVTFKGDAVLDGTRLTARLDTTAAGGAIGLQLKASLGTLTDVKSLLDYSLSLEVKRFEPHKWLEELPKGLIHGSLEVEGRGLPPGGTVDARLSLDGSRYEKLDFDTLAASVHVVDQEAEVRSLRVRAAALQLDAKGRADAKSARLHLDLSAPDLAATRAALVSGLGLALPPMSGRASLAADTAGTYAAPTATLTLDAPRLAYDANELTGLTASLALDRLSPPAGSLTNGRLESFHAAGVLGRKLRVAGKVDGMAMRLDLDGELAMEPATPDAAPSYLPLVLAAAATHAGREKGVDRWSVERIKASALGLDVVSKQSATVTTGGGRTTLDGLVLSLLGGTASLTGSFGPKGAFAAATTLDALRVEAVPEAMLPKGPALAGTVSGELSARGREGTTDADARLVLREVRYGELFPVAGELRARLDGKRADVKASVSLPRGGRLLLDTKMPLSAPGAAIAANDPNRIEGSLRWEGVDLALARPWMGDLPEVAGVLAGGLSWAGSWPEPRFDGSLEWKTFKGYGVDDLSGRLGLDWQGGRFAATLETARTPGLAVKATASFPLASAEVLAGRLPDWRALPIETSTALEALDLAWLASAGYAPPGTEGQLTGRLATRGALASIAADGAFKATGVSTGGYRGLGASLDFTADDRVAMRARTSLGKEGFVDADLTLGRPAGAVSALTLEEWLDVPVTMQLRLRPTAWQRLVPARPDEPPPGEAVQAKVAGSWNLSGTAAAPRTSLSFVVDEVASEGVRLGSATFGLDYADPAKETTFKGAFLSRDAGTVKVDGALAGSLSARDVAREGADALVAADPQKKAPTLRESLDAGLARLGRRALDLVVSSEAFDLSLLDGVVPGMRDLAGRLDLRLEQHGPADALALRGDVRLAGGRAAMPGFGVFSNVRLDLGLDGPRMDLRDFSGKSGSGAFSMSGKAGPGPGGGLRGSWSGALDAVPLVQNYQTRGHLTLKGDMPEWSWRDSTFTAPKLVLSQGLLKIPDLTSKAVQPMDEHPEIVVDGGKKAAPKAEPSTFRMNVGLEIPDDFRIDAPLGNTLVLGAKLDARIDPTLDTDGKGPFDLTGKVRLPRGTIRILQARFELLPTSSVTLFPRQWNDPTLDVKAQYDAKGVVVTAAFTGTASNMVRNLTSKPEMDEAEILYFVATGQRQSRAQSDPFALNRETLDDTLLGLAGSFGSSFARSFLQQYLGRAADLDVLSFDPRGNAKVGTYLWNGRLYLGAQVRPNANVLAGENTAELDAEYRINDRAYGRLRVGDQSRSGLEILYQDSVPAASQQRGKGR